MKKFKKFLGIEVSIRASHYWMLVLGAVIALAFLVNCGIYPFFKGCTFVDTGELILTASIFAGLGTARQIMLYKFKYLEKLQLRLENSTSNAEQILKERLWVPAVGWCLTVGFAVNMLVIPFFPCVRLVDWSFLESSLSIFLVLSGAREYGIYSQNQSESIIEVTKRAKREILKAEQDKTDDPEEQQDPNEKEKEELEK